MRRSDLGEFEKLMLLAVEGVHTESLQRGDRGRARAANRQRIQYLWVMLSCFQIVMTRHFIYILNRHSVGPDKTSLYAGAV
ncbi:MAG TPA: hypothetical protein VJ184_05995 [Chryseolinea sp.]|nr:hypothetical protein [Chryseolinea sp.]